MSRRRIALASAAALAVVGCNVRTEDVDRANPDLNPETARARFDAAFRSAQGRLARDYPGAVIGEAYLSTNRLDGFTRNSVCGSAISRDGATRIAFIAHAAMRREYEPILFARPIGADLTTDQDWFPSCRDRWQDAQGQGIAYPAARP